MQSRIPMQQRMNPVSSNSNDPFMRLKQGMAQGQSPIQVLQQMAQQNNPQAIQALQMINGRNFEDCKQMIYRMCQERGFSPEAIAQQISQRTGIPYMK